jgi:hypothetical protein
MTVFPGTLSTLVYAEEEQLYHLPVCIVANTPHALKTHESINPEQKQQSRIGTEVRKGSTLRDQGRRGLAICSSLETFSPLSSGVLFVSSVRSSIGLLEVIKGRESKSRAKTRYR